MVNEIGATSNQRLENQLIELTSLVRQLAVGQHQPALATKTESDQPENVGAIGEFQYGKQPSCRDQPMLTLNQMPACSLGQKQLSHCRFYLGPSQQRSQSQTKNC
ncbi:hypothetical protein CR513_41504, partial [Mucuna pruriens]